MNLLILSSAVETDDVHISVHCAVEDTDVTVLLFMWFSITSTFTSHFYEPGLVRYPIYLFYYRIVHTKCSANQW